MNKNSDSNSNGNSKTPNRNMQMQKQTSSDDNLKSFPFTKHTYTHTTPDVLLGAKNSAHSLVHFSSKTYFMSCFTR